MSTGQPRHHADVVIDIPFHDVDMLEIAWHGHYLKYFELARCVLLEQINYSYQQMRESGYIWPVIEARLRYVAPAYFGQKIRVRATLSEWENRLKIDYLVQDVATGAKLTQGHTIQVAVDQETRTMLLASPAVLLEKLGLDHA